MRLDKTSAAVMPGSTDMQLTVVEGEVCTPVPDPRFYQVNTALLDFLRH